MSVLKCTVPKAGYRGGACGCVLVSWIDHLGALRTRCPWCERQAAGVCRTCPRRTSSTRATYCQPCVQARRLARKRKEVLSPEQTKRKNKRRRERYKKDAAYRAARRADQLRWREKHPEAHRANMRRIYRTLGPERHAMLARKKAEYARRVARQRPTRNAA